MLVGTQSGKLDAVVVRTGVFAGSATLALGLMGSSAALAQTCGNLTLTPPAGQAGITWVGTLPPVATGLSGGLAISSAISAANTAFLTQSTAFVSAPANPKPDSEGSGIWVRGVGGELTLNTNTSINSNITVAGNNLNVPPGTSSGNTACSSQFHQTFGGFQLGYDMARLNVGGWNLTVGTTVGYLETNGSIVGGNVYGGAFNSSTQAPFVGTYAVATYGNFFIDGLIRGDYFETNLDSPTANLFNQKIDAHGFTAAASAGYNWRIPNSNWFVEPSAGVVWSRETVDPFNAASPVGGNNLVVPPGTLGFFPGNFSGTTQVNTIESVIGRLGVRVGTTLETKDVVYQPFAAVSVWHDFAGNVTANYSSCTGCFVVNNGNGGFVPSTLSASLSTNNIGTFGQYSLGVSGALKNTGWLGFARVDYREGPELHGISATGGIRYQFTPTETAGAMPVKAKAPVSHAVNWTGWYGGLIGGATEFGRGDLAFAPTQIFFGSTANTRPSGALGGGTLGYNYQVGKWVLGVEGDIAGTNTSGSSPCAPLDGNFLGSNVSAALFQTTCRDELNWIATATARLGYAWTPRSLLFVKVGGAFADEKSSVSCNLGPNNNANLLLVGQGCFSPTLTVINNNPALSLINSPLSVSTLRTGWTVGIGSEFALTDRWSIKGEFDWLDFGSKSLTLPDGTLFNSSLHIAEGKIGLNYKFWP